MSDQVQKTFNFYCDESCHLENDIHQYMLISYVSSAYNQVQIHHENIRELMEKHNFYAEIKWSNISKSQYAFYADLIDYFFATDLKFRCIVVDKEQVDNEKYSQDFDTFYYKMYYQLLYHQMDMRYAYNIYLDIKDTLSGLKIRKLREVLKLEYSAIRNLQNIRSHESLLMQLTDVIMGAISYHLNFDEKRVIAKTRLIKKIQDHSNLTLTKSPPKKLDKFNLFFIDLN
jgi:hypothetical protein